MKKCAVFFLGLFIVGAFFLSQAGLSAEVILKKPLPVPQQNQASIASFIPKAVVLQPGGPAAVVAVDGQYLETILSMQAIRESRDVGEISMKLVQPWPGSKRIELKAGENALIAQGYQLRVIGRASLNAFRFDIPLAVFSLEVAGKQTNKLQVQTPPSTLPTPGVSQVPKSGSPLAQMNLNNIGDIYKALMGFEQILCGKTYTKNFEEELRVLEQLLAKARTTFAQAIFDQRERATTISEIESQLKILENNMEEIRTKRQEAMTSFEIFDQKANQLFNILSTVLKNQKEVDDGISRNINQ